MLAVTIAQLTRAAPFGNPQIIEVIAATSAILALVPRNRVGFLSQA
jgi:hypothetical protein